jgi:hypothetical protein
LTPSPRAIPADRPVHEEYLFEISQLSFFGVFLKMAVDVLEWVGL